MADLIHKLGIDWKLLLAQVVNFFVLLFLLKKFLYRPILEILERRRRGVEQAAADAEKLREELAQLERRKAAELAEVRREADTMLQEAKRLAGRRHAEILQEGEGRVEQLLAEARQRLGEERAKMLDEIRGEVGDLVILAAERVLRERLGGQQHRRIVEEALAALRRV